MKKSLLIISIFFSLISSAQKNVEGYEIGLDASFNASSIGGVLELGPKFGFRMNENVILGPTIRYQRAWSQPYYSNTSFSYNNFGGGFFLHGRYKNVVYGGVEAVILRNRNVYIDTSAVFQKFVPTVFICAGFSKEFNGIVRLNAGLYYDVVNSLNSPFRNAYKMTIKDPTTGQIVKRIPLIYRISFFFPIGSKKDKTPIDPEEETFE
jgi:hypothetical protein